MKPHRFRMRTPGSLTVVFLAAAGVFVFALVWLGIAIVRQDRTLVKVGYVRGALAAAAEARAI